MLLEGERGMNLGHSGNQECAVVEVIEGSSLMIRRKLA
jgi:hypothetical protein